MFVGYPHPHLISIDKYVLLNTQHFFTNHENENRIWRQYSTLLIIKNISYYLFLHPGVARYVTLLLLLLFVLLHSSTIHPIVEADLILPHPFMNAPQLELEKTLCEVSQSPLLCTSAH